MSATPPASHTTLKEPQSSMKTNEEDNRNSASHSAEKQSPLPETVNTVKHLSTGEESRSLPPRFAEFTAGSRVDNSSNNQQLDIADSGKISNAGEGGGSDATKPGSEGPGREALYEKGPISEPPANAATANGSGSQPENPSNLQTPLFSPSRDHRSQILSISPAVAEKVRKNVSSNLTIDELDEDAIGAITLKNDKIVRERTRQILVHDVCNDSEDEQEEFRQVYQQEYDYMTTQELFKQTIKGLDQKTTNELRKAVGLKRRHGRHHKRAHDPMSPSAENHQDSDEDPSTPVDSRRLTRGMARSTRIRKREEREERENQGIEALLQAVKDIESEYGPLKIKRKRARTTEKPTKRTARDLREQLEPQRTSKGGGRGSKHALQSNGRRSKKGSSASKSSSSSLVAVMRKHRSRTVVFVTRIIVNGQPVRKSPGASGSEERIFPKSQGRLGPKKKRIAAKDSLPISSFAVSETSPFSTPNKKRRINDDIESVALREDVTNDDDSSFRSLSLLDWKRRQQWISGNEGEATTLTTPSKKSSAIVLPARIVDAGIDVGLPSWESINPIPRVPREPASTLEPPRKRHTNATYAKWCSKLINCLGGSGRMMAHYEFFYSDIDRPWFDNDEFLKRLALMGIPPTLKLTRSEWRVVRRCMPHRPSRFSRRFIMSELKKLELYRATVRLVQTKHSDSSKLRLPFDVPAPVTVGATVTAFCKRARLLHRGIVLAYDEHQHRYLVQFERKELGHAYCADIDVASHGVPEILIPAKTMFLDTEAANSFVDPHSLAGALAYGTTYGPQAKHLQDENKREIQKLMLISKQETMIHTKAAPSPDGISVIQSNDSTEKERENHLPDDEVKKKKLIRKVAEREMLVKLIGAIDMALTRKKMLLTAMEICHATLNQCKPSDDEQDADLQSFTDHYKWLTANLGLTNQSLEATIIHLQIMYGAGYAGDSHVEPISAADNNMMELESMLQNLSSFPRDSKLHKVWTRTMLVESETSCHQLVTRVLPDITTDPIASGRAEKENFLRARLKHMCQLLFAINYVTPRAKETSVKEKISITQYQLKEEAVGDVMQTVLNGIRPSPLAVDTSENDLLEKADKDRELAFEELKSAVSLLQSEFSATGARKSFLDGR